MSLKLRPFGRSENSWASPNGDFRSSQPHPKSPVSPMNPWSSNNNVMPGKFKQRRGSSFEDSVDVPPLTPKEESGALTEEPVFITHVESPVRFWAQAVEAETAHVIEKMTSDLQIYCRNKPLLQSTPHIGKIYGGVYLEDQQWYRCRVKELIEDDKVKVHFVDFGNTEVISLRSIVFLSHDFLSPAPFAQLYCLYGVAVTSEELLVEGSNMLHNLTNGKFLTIQLKEPRRALDVACAVELRDDSEGGIGNIAEELIRHGLVISTFAEQHKSGFCCSQSDADSLFVIILIMKSVTIHRTSLSEAISKEMEELTKENQLLRNRIKVYKEGEKAVDELRKYYSAQAAKHKENMEQAVSHKVLDLVGKVHDLKAMRDAAPANGKTSELIKETIVLTRNDRIHLKNLKSLQQVQELEKNLQQAQDDLRHCEDKKLFSADLIPKRDEVRQMFVDSIDLFCKEVDLLPLQQREKCLQDALVQLQDRGGINSLPQSCDLAVEEAVKAYEDWVERTHQDMADVRQKVNQCTDDLVTALSNLQSALVVLQKSSEAVSTSLMFDDMDTLINALTSAIHEEMDKSKVSEDKEAQQLVDQTIKALIGELNKELQEIQELRDNLVINYKGLQTDMGSWLQTKPDIKKVIEIKRSIKTLRSRLRHRLADRKDLEEGDEPETAEDLQKVEKDISEIYLKLHQSFEDESNFLADVAKAALHHFPELPIAHPELGISEYLASNGLVKPGRELEHYPHHDSVPSVSHDKCSVIKTEFAGRPCILKELSVDREVGDIETLKKNAVHFSSVKNPYLMQLDAFFAKGNRAFVQMPLLMSAEEWIALQECSPEGSSMVLRDILEALNSLHSQNISHGCIHLQSVFVEKRSGEYRGVLDFYPFINTQSSPSQDMKLFGELIVKMNFPNKDSTTTFSQLTEDADLLAVLGDLLDTDDFDRLTAQQTLQHAYFCKCV
ncbi:unnamed protein product [Pocillopora meandrina]|uniref:Tudor domain-containing protein n=1 Tax=Pocillopora meandrina TaxID=46732 RepID=A0AAU9WKW4_9CNID|nr:unnamed protein product [Pocillopora meandrina]